MSRGRDLEFVQRLRFMRVHGDLAQCRAIAHDLVQAQADEGNQKLICWADLPRAERPPIESVREQVAAFLKTIDPSVATDDQRRQRASVTDHSPHGSIA